MSKYIPPSACQSCVPVVTHGYQTTDYAHETACPNNQERTNG